MTEEWKEHALVCLRGLGAAAAVLTGHGPTAIWVSLGYLFVVSPILVWHGRRGKAR